MVASDLISRHVEVDAQRWGPAGARLRDSGVEVWALVAQLPAMGGDVARLADAYGLPLEVVEAAFAYYRAHKQPIDARIALNAA